MAPATPEDGPKKRRRTLPAITDMGCLTLACVGAMIALIALIALVF